MTLALDKAVPLVSPVIPWMQLAWVLSGTWLYHVVYHVCDHVRSAILTAIIFSMVIFLHTWTP